VQSLPDLVVPILDLARRALRRRDRAALLPGAALVWLGALVVTFPYIPGSTTGRGLTVFAG
jgi:hypothetical protein